ncbi:MAG: type II toxin-antitoxin system VapC family toxin [Spirochaetaceae bacterium]|nr:type II toxin-antitoxin system VapC family toxin [Spirochaetaceae bacterium]
MDLNLNSDSVIFMDTAPFICYFEDHIKYGQIVDQLISQIYENGSSFLTSYITYSELITKPKQLNREDLVAKYRAFFTNSESLSLCPLNLIASEKTAEIRAHYGFKTPDSIQLATAVSYGADYIITNDKEWMRFTEIPVLILDDL